MLQKIDLTVVSVSRTDFITISCNSASSIFAVNVKNEIEEIQIADDEFQNRVNAFDFGKREGLGVKKCLLDIEKGTKFLCLEGRREEYWYIVGMSLKVKELNSRCPSIHKKAFVSLGKIILQYATSAFFFDSKQKHFGEEDKNKRICRFCEKSTPATSFRFNSHAVSEAIGNKSLICLEECDSCNKYFDKNIESDIVNLHLPLLTAYGIKGKNGYRTTTGDNFKLKIQKSVRGGKPYTLITFQFPDIPEDKDAIIDFLNNYEYKAEGISYTPQNVYKCLCKYVLSVLPSRFLPAFKATIEWIKEPTKERNLPQVIITDNNPDDKLPDLSFSIRRNQDYRLPFCVGSLAVATTRYIFIMPFSSYDQYDSDTEAQNKALSETFQEFFPNKEFSLQSLSSHEKTALRIESSFSMDPECQEGRDYIYTDKPDIIRKMFE